MIRLVTSRKEKKERKRLMREESSNLSAIADPGSLVHSVSSVFQYDSDDVDSHDGVMADAGERRNASGERRRVTVDEASGRSRKKGWDSGAKRILFTHRTEKTTKRAAIHFDLEEHHVTEHHVTLTSEEHL
jgi:hypothetical protein